MSHTGTPKDYRRFSDGGRPDINAMHGGTQADTPQYGDDFFVYSASLGNLANGASTTVVIQIQQDAAFEWIEATCSGFLHGVTSPPQDNTIIPVNIQITDTGNGRNLFFQPVPINSIAGTGKQPFILPVSKVFVPLASVTVAATNTSGTDTWDALWLVLIGRRVFEYGSSRASGGQ